jgi:tetratricopeptide (TPR) repeat protein
VNNFVTSKPQKSVVKLIERVNTLLTTKRERNQFVLNSLKKDAQALLKVDAFSANIVLGMVACLERNAKAAREFHLKAIRICDNFEANINFATSLDNLGARIEAAQYYEKALKFQPDSITVVRKFTASLVSACNFRHARLMFERWRKLDPKITELDLGAPLSQFESVVESNKVSDEQTLAAQAIVIKCMMKRNAVEEDISVEVLEEDGFKWIDHVIGVNKNIDEVIDMNYELAQNLVEVIDVGVLNTIVTRFSATGDEKINPQWQSQPTNS